MNQTDAIEEAYKKAGLPVTVYRLENSGHGGIEFYTEKMQNISVRF